MGDDRDVQFATYDEARNDAEEDAAVDNVGLKIFRHVYTMLHHPEKTRGISQRAVQFLDTARLVPGDAYRALERKRRNA